MKFVDLTGHRFSRLVAIKLLPKTGIKLRYECLCDCGTVTNVLASNLRGGQVRSCGCIGIEIIKERNFKHGMVRTPIYRVWRNMLDRCERPSNNHYSSYGGRGIAVCERWHIFANFYADMGDVPKGLQIDRIDNDKGYYKENCRWATTLQSANNKSNNFIVEFSGQQITVTDLARRVGLQPKTLKYRLLAGWPIDVAVSRPPASLRK